jgi:hypothetical protein
MTNLLLGLFTAFLSVWYPGAVWWWGLALAGLGLLEVVCDFCWYGWREW